MDGTTIIALVGVILGVPATILAVLQILDRMPKKPQAQQSFKAPLQSNAYMQPAIGHNTTKNNMIMARFLFVLLFISVAMDIISINVDMLFYAYRTLLYISRILVAITSIFAIAYPIQRKQPGWFWTEMIIILLNIAGFFFRAEEFTWVLSLIVIGVYLIRNPQ